MTGADANALAMALKPLALLLLTFVFAVATWLVRRFGPPRLQRVLLYKLWDIHPKPRPLHLGNYNVGYRAALRVRAWWRDQERARAQKRLTR